MVTPIINGNALTCLKEQFTGFWRNLTKRALLKETLVQESLQSSGKWTTKSN